jgi:malate dehydrogenase
MGAEQDSLRFARAIAHDLGISRHQVLASALGEHGKWMVPLWSSVELTQPNAQLLVDLVRMKEKSKESPLAQRVAALRSKVQGLIENEEINEAYEVTRQELPDARIFIQPLITWRTMNSTPYATASATLKVLTAALSDNWLPYMDRFFSRVSISTSMACAASLSS